MQIQDKIWELHPIQIEDNPEFLEAELPVKEELHSLLEQEDLHWKQRAKENWLRYGNQNSKFFHACASQKHRRKQVEKIKDKEGRVCTSNEDIEVGFVLYYKDLFNVGEEVDMEACIGALECKVTPLMNQKLLAEFTTEEISLVLQQMSPLKALGPDGFFACFYQHN